MSPRDDSFLNRPAGRRGPARPVNPGGRAALQRRRAQVRRRRLGALLGLVVIIALAVVVAGSGGGGTTGTPAAGGAKAAGVKPAAHHISPTLAARQDLAIDQLLRHQPFITAGGSERREIALTFDDGPGPYTPALLDQLQRLHVPATFFEIGSMIHYFHAASDRALAMGEVIGDHTELHPMMAKLSPAMQQNEIVVQTEQLHKYGGPTERLYRPPYGSFNQATLSILHQLHMLMVLWTIDTADYTQPGVSTIVQRVLSGARPGAIILMHDGGGTRTETVAAVPLIVRALRARGYRLVTVPELVRTDPPNHHEVLPTGLAGS